MEQFRIMLNLQLQLLILVLLGIIAGKKKMITKSTRQSLTDIFINFILPCNIFLAFNMKITRDLLYKGLMIIIVTLVCQLFCYVLSRVLYRNTNEGKRKVLQYATLCSNSGFMGNPVVQGVYGSQGLLYASIAMIPIRVFMWSFGLSVFTTTDGKSTIKKLLTHPCIIAVELGILRMAVGIELPVFINKSMENLSSCVTAISMIIIGSILAEIDIKSILNKQLLFYSFIRLIFIPGVIFIVLRLINMDNLITGVTVLLAGMPAASLTAILAAKYEGDFEFASKCVFFSTIASLFTLPVFSMLIG